MAQAPRVALPQINLSFALVGKVDPTKPVGQQVELKQPSNHLLIGQVYLALASPLQVMLPMRAVAPQGSGPIILTPLSARWYCDHCEACTQALLEVLCRAKGIEFTPPAGNTGEVTGGEGEVNYKAEDQPPREAPEPGIGAQDASPVNSVETSNDNSPSKN